jgi:hypothetical protein
MSYELIFWSRRTAALGRSDVSRIVEHARTRNRALGVTSLLTFDGENFCQLLEGEAATVDLLAETIAGDRRHDNFVVLYRSRRDGRRFPKWPMAFAMWDSHALPDTIARHAGEMLATWMQNIAPIRLDTGI